jgi:pimeloyl-ACP methyl ester carboxylesterase
MASVDFEQGPGATRLAFLQDGPADNMNHCGFFWLGGFMSDMTGSKAEALASLARDARRPATRFDYSGHGQSEGVFVDGTISAWLEQAAHMFLTKTQAKRVIVGSSMGGWLALLLARMLMRDDPRHAKRIAGLVLIAPAADMTSDLMWDEFTPTQRATLEERGVYLRPSDYGDPYPITLKLLRDGKHHLLLDKGMELPYPIRILQGTADTDVPPSHALKVFEALTSPDVTMTLIKGGDHRLSTPGNLKLIRETVLQLAERADGITL